MPTYVNTWAEATPAGSEERNLGDDRIREFKRAIRERLATDHQFLADESGYSTIGYHKAVHLITQSDPSAISDGGIIYTKDVAGKAELHFIDEDSNVLQLTSAGKIPNAALYSGGVPAGLIAIWAGTIATIPSGWNICDGNNSTPNLLAKFVRGVATAATNPGTTGGADTHDHGAVTGSHVLTTAEIPSHTHSILQVLSAKLEGNYTQSWGAQSGGTSGATGGGGGHTHTITEGSSLPAYYAVAFIRKS